MVYLNRLSSSHFPEGCLDLGILVCHTFAQRKRSRAVASNRSPKRPNDPFTIGKLTLLLEQAPDTKDHSYNCSQKVIRLSGQLWRVCVVLAKEADMMFRQSRRFVRPTHSEQLYSCFVPTRRRVFGGGFGAHCRCLL